MGWVVMSERELGRIEVLSRVVERRMSVAHAAEVLGLSPRQVQRLLRTFREDGAPALRHKARGRPSNNRLRDGVRDLALAFVRESYADFGPTLAAEKLAERPLPPTHTSNCVPAALVAARASSMSSARGSRSYALSRPVGWTSSEKRMSCVTVRLIEAKLAPS